MEQSAIQNHQIHTYTKNYNVGSNGYPSNASAPAQNTQQDPALVNWYEQAVAYYDAVISGDPSTAKPGQDQWNEFLKELDWAAGQLGYASPNQAWDPMNRSSSATGSSAGGQPQSNQFGGVIGPMGSYTYTDEKARIGFTGNGTHDIWSNDVNIDVAPLSAQVSSQIVTDTRMQPPEQVLKIVVHDFATNTDAVYFVHDYADAQVKVNTPKPSQFTDDSGLVTNGAFKPQDAASGPEASIEGELQADGKTTLYEADGGEVIDFNPVKGDDDGIFDIYGDANINVKGSDHVDVTMNWGSNGLPNGEYTVVVTHRDGSKDTFKIHKGFHVNLNANPAQVTWNGTATYTDDQDPLQFEFKGIFTLNGEDHILDVITSDTAADAAQADSIVSNLLSLTDRNEAQLLTALRAAGYTEFNSIDDLKKAIENKTFPGEKPSGKLLNFLMILDPTISQSAAEGYSADIQDKDGSKKKAFKEATARVVELLGALYPDHIIQAAHANPVDWAAALDISFDGAVLSTGYNVDGSGTHGDVYDNTTESYI